MNDSLNVCLFSRVNYWQGIKGGMDLHGKIISEALVRQGHRVVVISSRHPEGKISEQKNGVTFYYLKNTVFGSRRKGWAGESTKKFFALNKRKPFNLVWSQSFDAFGFAGRGKKLHHPPIVATIHGSVVQEAKSFFATTKIKRKNYRKYMLGLAGLFYAYFISQKPLLSVSDRVICVSEAVSNDIGRWFGKRYIERSEIIENGVDVEIFIPDMEKGRRIRERYGIPVEQKIILTIGRLSPEKGHHLVVDALKKLCNKKMDVCLMVVGHGEYMEAIQDLAVRLEVRDRVIFTGFVAHNEVAEYYNAADIFVMPTLTIEGLPFVILEAMACGTPVIASRLGGNKILDHGANGLLVEPGNVDAIVENIERLINDRDMRNTLTMEGRKLVVGKYSLERMVSKTLSVMKKEADRDQLWKKRGSELD